MTNIHNKDICFVYVDNIETYNNTPKEDSYIYFVKNYGIFIGTRKVSNYVNRVSQLFNDENYISVDDASTLIAEAVSNLVNATPEMLDTLYELGLVIAEDPNFAAAMTEALANIDSILQQKKKKKDGKQLSTEDYTTEEKQKLESLYNYDDSNLNNRISDLENAHYFDNNDEIDPIFTAHIASHITDGSINYWNSKQDRLFDTSISYWNNKQETISDLQTIRDGAALGATALQEHQPIMTINNTSIIGEGNVNISGLPDVSISDNDKILMVVNGEWQMVKPPFVYVDNIER